MKATKPKSLFAKAAKFALAALLVGALAFTGCSSGDDDDDDKPGTSDIIPPDTPTPPDEDGEEGDYQHLLYEADFENETVAHGWGAYVNGFNAAPDRGTVTVADGYLQLKPTGAVFFATATQTEPNTLYAVPKDTDYKLTFDLLLPTDGDKAHTFAISNANGFAGLTSGTDSDGHQANPQSGAFMIKDNILLSLVQTAAKEDTWTLNDDKTVTLTLGKWYSFTVEVVGDKTYLTATPKSSGAAAGIARTAFTTNGGGLGAFYYATNGASETIGFDNIVIRIKNDVLSVTVDTESESAEVTYGDTITLTASSSWLSSDATPTATYTWSLPDDTTAVTLPADKTGASIVVTNVNNTITDVPVKVSVKAEANGAEATNSYTVTAKANAALLHEIVFEDDEINIAANDTETLTFTGGTLVDGQEGTVTYTWTTSDKSNVLFVVDDTEKDTAVTTEASVIIKGKAKSNEPVAVTVAAQAGSITKKATIAVNVAESTATLSKITLNPKNGTVATGGKSITFTATANDGVAPDSWEVTASPEGIVEVDKEETADTCTVTVTSKNTMGTVTITVTATKGSARASEEYILTVDAPKPLDVYSQDYSDLEAVPLEWGGYVNRYSEGRGEATVSDDGYVILAGAADGNKGVFFATHKGDYNEKAVIANGEDYQLSFDFASVYYGNGASGPYKLLISNANGSALNTGDNPQGGTTTDANVLLSLEQLSGNSADWKVNGDDNETVTIEQYGVNDTVGNQVARVDTKTWHRFVVTRKGTETILQILKLDDEGNSTTEVYSKTFESEVGGLGEIQFAAKIAEGRQAAYFDNLIVTAYR